MSSNDHKKFKTDATQKTSTDTEIISDTVLLPPYSTDHVLTVTAPSNTSGLTGQVDVELEMSPDGENWCPVKAKQTTASTGTGTSTITEENANLKAVSTIPDPTHPTAQYKNKFAIGSLSYDNAGVEQLNENTGTRDFMHQFISKDKPFNYSIWTKTNTTEQAFADDYSPVIFRHGGKDLFTNEAVLQLTDTATQNLSVVNFVNGNYLRLPTVSNSTDTSLNTSGGTVHSPRWSASNQSNTADIFSPQSGYTCIGFWFRNNAGTSSSTKYKSIVKMVLSNGWHVEIALRGDSSNNRSIGFYVRDGGTSKYFKYFNMNAFKDGAWHYMMWTINSDGSGALATNFFLDGTYYTTNTKTFGSMTNVNSANMTNVTITELIMNSESYPGYLGLTDLLDIDSLVFIHGLLDLANHNLIYDPSNNVDNTNNPYNVNFTNNAYVASFFRFGDGPNDSISTPSSATIEGSSYIELTSGNLTPTFNTYIPGLASEKPREVTAEEFPSIFDINVNSSISGWFKTDNNSTGTLFSNMEGAGTAGLKLNINALDMTLSLLSSQVDITISKDVNDDAWHHLVLTKTQIDGNLDTTFKVYIDGVLEKTHTQNNITNADLKGTNGFTLLGDGQNNANAQSPGATDPSKPGASLSNWSFHTEVLNLNAVKEMYSNGRVRNIKNLVNVNVNNIIHWWKFSSSSNPASDSIGTVTFNYQDGNGDPITSKVASLTSGPMYIVEEDQYGSGITLSLTKRFNTTTNEWTNVHTNDTCVCLSFNGFEDQAEYFAIYNPTTDVADNNWHNIILSFSGKEGAATTAITNFCFRTDKHNFVLSVDGTTFKEAHYVGTLAGTVTNKCFVAEERHLKWDNNSEEDYMPHSQLNSNIFKSINQNDPVQNYQPVAAKDYKTSFIGYADESSFHSESWFSDASGLISSIFNDEKPATMYGSSNTPSNRGVGTDYPAGTPYPLRRPSEIGSSSATGNQYIDPEKYDASTNPDGGLEAWWRWGDTIGDCSANINDNIGFEGTNTNAHRSLTANNYVSATRSVTDPNTGATVQLEEDLFFLTSSDSIYVATSTGGGGTSTTTSFEPIILESILAGKCNVKSVIAPILQYIRVKFTNSGEAQLGEGKVEAAIHYRKRRER